MKKNEIVKYILVPVLLIIIVFLLIEKDDKVEVTEKEVWDAMEVPESREAPKSYDEPTQEPEQPESKPDEQPSTPEPKQDDGEAMAYYQDIEGAFIQMGDGMSKISLGIETGDIAFVQEGAESLMFSSDIIYSLSPPKEAEESHLLLLGLADVNGRIASNIQNDLNTGSFDYLNSYQFVLDLEEATGIMQRHSEMLELETQTQGVNTL